MASAMLGVSASFLFVFSFLRLDGLLRSSGGSDTDTWPLSLVASFGAAFPLVAAAAAGSGGSSSMETEGGRSGLAGAG